MQSDEVKNHEYFYQYFSRCHQVGERVTSLVDCVTMLCQAAEPLIEGTLHTVRIYFSILFTNVFPLQTTAQAFCAKSAGVRS